LSDLFILGVVYLSCGFLVYALYLTIRSSYRSIRYAKRLKGISDYAESRDILGSDTKFPLFHEFNHHLVTVPKMDGSDNLVLRRSVDAFEIFTDDRLAAGLSSNRIFQALPGILTGLGVLGTFIGLQLGIGGLDLQDLTKLETSIVPLIQGCAVAFSTSVWGVGTGLLFSFLEKLLEGLANRKVRRLQQQIDSLVPRYVPEEAMADLARSSRSSEDLLKGLAVAIGNEMQKAIGRLGTEIKDAVSSATSEGQGQLAEQSAQLLSSAITTEIGKLKDTIDGMGQKFTDDFGAASGELSQQIASFGPTVTSMAESVSASNDTVSNAVTKLNAHESVMLGMSEASEKLKQAADSFVSMNGTLETSASRNREAADAQNAAANVNQEVAAKFGAVAAGLPEIEKTITEAASVIGSLGAPLVELQSLLSKQPELHKTIEGQRAASEDERNTKLLNLSNDLAETVGKAVEEFSKVGTIAEELVKASSSLEGASSGLATFGQQVLQASNEQRTASEASRDAATASRQTTDMLVPLPKAFTELSGGLSLAAVKLKEGADSAAASYKEAKESQRVFFQGANAGLTAMRDRMQEIIAAYGNQIEGQTQQLMNQWTQEVTECLKSYDAQVQTLDGSLEELQEVISNIKRSN
jgi:methyl-accepting chemotaxis protein